MKPQPIERPYYKKGDNRALEIVNIDNWTKFDLKYKTVIDDRTGELAVTIYSDNPEDASKS